MKSNFQDISDEYLINSDEKDYTCEDDNEEDDKKQGMTNSEFLPPHARWLEHTAMQRGEGGLVWRWRGLEDYTFSCLLFQDREYVD